MLITSYQVGCPVRSIFPEALDMLRQKQHLLGYPLQALICAMTWSLMIHRFMSNKIMPMSEAVEGYVSIMGRSRYHQVLLV